MGTDTRGQVHSLTTTDTTTADTTQLDDLLHGRESTLDGDKGYWKETDGQQWEQSGGTYRVNRRGVRTPRWDAINRARSRVRPGASTCFMS